MIYFIKSGRYVKIGYTKKFLKRRLEDLQIGNPVKLEPLGMIEGDRRYEAMLHSRFGRSHVRGEWYRLTDEISAFIDSNLGKTVEELDREWRRELSAQAADLIREPVT